MTKRMLAKSAKSLVVFAFIALVLVQTVGLLQTTNNVDTHAQNMDGLLGTPTNQATSELSTLPFFQDTEGVLEWLTDYLYNTQTALTSQAYYAETNRDGTTITDNKTYIEDFAVYVDGLADLMVANPAEVPAIISNQMNYELWDNVDSNAGFYSYVEDDWETTSDIKEFDGNAQIILSLIGDSLASSTINTQFVSIENNFWDDSALLYNHSTVDYQKYIQDQFIGAIIGFLTERESGISNSYSHADTLMNYLHSEGDGIIKGSDTKAFYYRYSEDGLSPLGDSNNDDFYLETNAYGIWALVEQYINLGANDDWILEQAEDLYTYIESILWNSTYSLFMHKIDTDLGTTQALNQTISLQENAVMMVALKRLFEVTGDQTYFDKLMEMYDAIEIYFRDSVYGNYYTSVQGSVLNTNKNLNTHAYYYRALAEVATLSDYMTANLLVNETDLIRDEMVALEIEGSYIADIVLNYVTALIENEVTIAHSDFYFNIRNPEGIVINETQISNSLDGTFSVIFPILDSYEPGTYEISLYANYTGLVAVIKSVEFNILSGLTYDSVSFDDGSNEVMIGARETINVSVSSNRVEDFNFTAKTTGDQFVEHQVDGFVGVDEEESYSFIITVDLLSDLELGAYELTVEILNGTTIYDRFTVDVIAISPLDVVEIEQDRYAFLSQAYNMKLVVKNQVETDQNCTLVIWGEDITYQTQELDFGNNAVLTIPLIIELAEDLTFGTYNFNIEINRNSDEDIFYYETFELVLKPEIEIITVEVPDVLTHGEIPSVMCIVQNNIDEVYPITFVVDGEIVETIQLVPGESNFVVPLGSSVKNPYKFGSKVYEFEIKDSNQQVIYEKVIITDLTTSFSSLFFGYILPILVPVIGLVVVRHFALENKKRLSI